MAIDTQLKDVGWDLSDGQSVRYEYQFPDSTCIDYVLVDTTNGKTLLPDKLWRFVWTEEVDSIYIYALFRNLHVRQESSILSTGTSASLRNISRGKLKVLELPIAPIAD